MAVLSEPAQPYRHCCGINCFTFAAELSLQITRPAFGHAGHEAGQFHQIYEPEQSARLPHDDLRVGSDGVGPLRRNRTDCAVIKAQQEALTLAVGPFANAGASPSAERVKGVGYKNLLRGSDGNVCFLR